MSSATKSRLKPAFEWFDVQVNGALGLDFNADDWSFESADLAAQRWLEMGCHGLLATVITDSLPSMQHRIARVATWIESSELAKQCVAGIHVEGPFLNSAPGYIGAHPPEWTRDADQASAQSLLDAGRGHVRMLTLAPERDPDARVTKNLSDQGIIVGMGHCEGSLEDIARSLDAGLRLFTHLGNGCPHQIDRHDNLVNRVLSYGDRIKVTFIADGHHIPFFALKNYIAMLPPSQVIIVSDAMQAAGLPPGEYRLGQQVVHVDQENAAWIEDRSRYAGSATLLPVMAQKLLDAGFADTHTIQRWILENPRSLIQAN